MAAVKSFALGVLVLEWIWSRDIDSAGCSSDGEGDECRQGTVRIGAMLLAATLTVILALF